MNVIIACEKFGRVRDAFIRAGHNAISCDTSPSVSPGPHLLCDIRCVDLAVYDLLIAFPPCTYLCKASAWRWRQERARQLSAVEFVKYLWDAPVARICIENPPGILPTLFRPYDELVNPWWFGHREMKQTCFWLKNLPPLMATLVFPDPIIFVERLPQTSARSDIRGRTFEGVASAMATQWGSLS